jgi:FtsZ-binding cell division protein ZapB
MSEASETLYTFNSEETIRAQCRAREDYIRRQKMFQYRIDELTTENETLLSENDKLSSENGRLSSENDKLSSDLEALRKLLDKHGIAYPEKKE